MERLLSRALRSGQPQEVGGDDRRTALADLRAWRADAVVLDATDPAADAVRTTMARIYAVDGVLVGGVWVWDVRALA